MKAQLMIIMMLIRDNEQSLDCASIIWRSISQLVGFGESARACREISVSPGATSTTGCLSARCSSYLFARSLAHQFVCVNSAAGASLAALKLCVLSLPRSRRHIYASAHIHRHSHADTSTPSTGWRALQLMLRCVYVRECQCVGLMESERKWREAFI